MKPIIEGQGFWGGFSICLTNKCNLLCRYCSRNCGAKKNESIPVENVKQIIDLFYKNNPNGKKVVLFTGGEIFVYDHINEVIKYALDRGFICQLQTNGILLPMFVRERPDIYSDGRLAIKISLDGWNSDIHEKYRGRDTFELVTAGVRSALSINPNIGLKTVVHDSNFPEIRKMLDFCLELGINGWSYNTLMDRGRSKKSTTITEMDLTKKLIPLFKMKKYHRLLNGTNIQTYLWLIATKRRSLSPYCFINNDGGVYVTDRTVNERRVGSIYSSELNSIFTTDMRKVSRLVDLTVESGMLRLVASHFDVEIEGSSL